MYSYILLVSDHDEVAMYPTVNKQLITNKPTVKLVIQELLSSEVSKLHHLLVNG